MDTLSKERRSTLMSRIRSSDTGPEKVVRGLLSSLGYRYRLQVKTLPGKPDIAVTRFKTAIFVHGCFWHGCTRCDRGTRIPKTNTDKWLLKIKQNKERDARVQAALGELGWRVLVVWSCDLVNLDELENKLVSSFQPM
jgi:DNA mismatch endonuclease, patch repair protein